MYPAGGRRREVGLQTHNARATELGQGWAFTTSTSFTISRNRCPYPRGRRSGPRLRAVLKRVGRVGLAADAEWMDFEDGFASAYARANLEHVRAEHPHALGIEVVDVILHERGARHPCPAITFMARSSAQVSSPVRLRPPNP